MRVIVELLADPTCVVKEFGPATTPKSRQHVTEAVDMLGVAYARTDESG